MKAEKGIIKVNEGAIAVALAALICFLGSESAIAIGWPDAGKPTPFKEDDYARSPVRYHILTWSAYAQQWGQSWSL